MREIDYIFLIAGKEFSSNFLISWTDTVKMLNRSNVTFDYAIFYSPVIVRTRNTMFEMGFSDGSVKEKIFGGQTKCKKIIMLDDDIVWSVENMIDLIDSPHDIVSGIYSTEDMETTALMNPDRIKIIDINKKTKPFEVEGAGLGFMAIKFEVLQSLEYPWFNMELTEKGLLGEDTYFCNLLRNKGYKIIADPNIKVGHIKTKILSV